MTAALETRLQVAGFALVEAKADHKNDLRYIAGLLRDAKDALAINEQGIAERRIERALKLITERLR